MIVAYYQSAVWLRLRWVDEELDGDFRPTERIEAWRRWDSLAILLQKGR